MGKKTSYIQANRCSYVNMIITHRHICEVEGLLFQGALPEEPPRNFRPLWHDWKLSALDLELSLNMCKCRTKILK